MTKRGPRCPNHGVHLVECQNGIGICPISGATFSYSEDHYEKTKKLKVTALGGMVETGDYDVKHLEGEDA